MVNIKFIIERLQELTGINSKKELAVLFGLSAADFSNRKRRGSLLPLIIDWAINENVNVNWLLTGEEESQPLASPRAAAFLDNWEHLSEEDKAALERMAFALAQSQKKMKKAE